ncbi:MAG TPA: YraN family protein [Methylocystis sp.]|nr:YraN family protein [Methylocystis sp.]
MTVASRRAARAFGLRAETLAALWLRLKGYRVLARQFRVPAGEVDIIATRFRTIVFVEVKARGDLEDALVAITPQKLRRFRFAAARWLAQNPWAADHVLRADAVYVAPRRLPRHVENVAELGFG